jgi:hypothetical protein
MIYLRMMVAGTWVVGPLYYLIKFQGMRKKI